jgi:hypothetical protein
MMSNGADEATDSGEDAAAIDAYNAYAIAYNQNVAAYNAQVVSYNENLEQGGQASYQPSSSPTTGSQCFAQLKDRPVDDWRARLRGATHAFWYVQDSTETQYILTAGPDQNTGKYLDMYTPKDVTHDKNNVGASTWFDSGVSSNNCSGVDKMVKAAKAWPQDQIIYSYKGPNSNGVAKYLGTVGGFSPSPPPGSVGWDKPIPFPNPEQP